MIPHRPHREIEVVQATAPRVPWPDFVAQLDWRQGEHFGLIGPTGGGKTVMLLELIKHRDFVVLCATKARDGSLSGLVVPWYETWSERGDYGYTVMRRWYPRSAKRFPRRILWPRVSTIDATSMQQQVFEHAFSAIYREGGWCVALDEVSYMTNTLSLAKEVKMLLMQGRSLGISVIAATQRPAYVPLEIYSQSTHLMFWQDADGRNLKRIGEMNYTRRDEIAALVALLERHQVLYVNTRTGQMVRTHVEVSNAGN